nr:hypothetical protein [Candidatus Sigynarchaeota archaeon]
MPDFDFNALDGLMAPIDKEKNKAAMIEKLQASFANGMPFIDYCDQYVYLSFPSPDGKEWTEFSFMRGDGNLSKDKRDPENAFHVIKEEIIRGLGEVFPDLITVNAINAIAAKHDKEPKGFIAEIIQALNPKVPIVRKKDELQKVIDMVKTA